MKKETDLKDRKFSIKAWSLWARDIWTWIVKSSNVRLFSYLNPALIPTALSISLGIFGGASMMAYSMPK